MSKNLANSCPLCNSTNISTLEHINVDDLLYLYKKKLRIDIIEEVTSINRITFYNCNTCALKFFYPFIAGSEKFYEELQKFSWYYLNEKQEYDIAKKIIKTTDNVLEVGCGKGAFAKLISAKKYVGLELSNKAIEEAKKKRPKCI